MFEGYHLKVNVIISNVNLTVTLCDKGLTVLSMLE